MPDFLNQFTRVKYLKFILIILSTKINYLIQSNNTFVYHNKYRRILIDFFNIREVFSFKKKSVYNCIPFEYNNKFN